MINYILYPILELKGFIIFFLGVLIILTATTVFLIGRSKKGMKHFGWQTLLFGRTDRQLVLISLGISHVVFAFSMVLFMVPMGRVPIAALIVMCGIRVLLSLSFVEITGEIVYGCMTALALTAGNLLLDYMRETGIDFYILAVWIMLSLFLLQYSIYYFIKGLERMLAKDERANSKEERAIRRIRKAKKENESA